VTELRDLLELPDYRPRTSSADCRRCSCRDSGGRACECRGRACACTAPRTIASPTSASCSGLAAFAGGCGWIFPPAAPIVGGAFLAAVAWIEQRGRATAEDEPATRTVERWYSDDDDEEV
jgi:hypothetical protein